MEFLFKLTRTLSAPHTGWWWSEQGKSQVASFFELTRPPWGLFWKSLELLAFLCFPLASPSSSLQSTFRFLRLTLRILERSLSFGTESLLLSSCTWSTKNIFVSPSLGVETQNWLDPRPSRRTVRPWIVEWGERIREMWFIRKWCKISARELFPSVIQVHHQPLTSRLESPLKTRRILTFPAKGPPLPPPPPPPLPLM